MTEPRCGTTAGHQAHRTRGEKPREACREARRRYSREWKRRRGVRPWKAAQCGTASGYTAHYARGEKPCGPCREAQRIYYRAYRRRKGLGLRMPAECGTVSGYRAHRSRGETPCGACGEANRIRAREYYFAHRAEQNEASAIRRRGSPPSVEQKAVAAAKARLQRVADPENQRLRNRKRMAVHREQMATREREWREANAERIREAHRKRAEARRRLSGLPPKGPPGRPRTAECGTPGGYSAHHKHKETPCDACREAWRVYSREWRESHREASNAYKREWKRRKGVQPWRAAQCGTISGYVGHYRRGEPPCKACRGAEHAYRRELRRRRAA